jgi:translation initiation factor 1A
VLNEAYLKELILPSKDEMFGRVVKLVGSDHIMVRCADGKTRMGRIRGKLRRRVWIRDNDVVLLAPWDFKQDSKCDIVWRYTLSQVQWLTTNGKFPEGF